MSRIYSMLSGRLTSSSLRLSMVALVGLWTMFGLRSAQADTVNYIGAGNQTWTNPDADGDWSGGDGTFNNGDDAIFNNTGAGTVTITGSLAPNSVLFNNTFGNNFIFQTGNLNNGGDFTMSGGGNVTLSTVSMLPVLGNVTVNSGTLTYNNSERIGSLSGVGALVGTAGNNILRFGWNNSDTTFSGTVTQGGGGPSSPSFDKLGKGTTTINVDLGINLGHGGVGVTDGKLLFNGNGKSSNRAKEVRTGGVMEFDNSGMNIVRLDAGGLNILGGEVVARGNASADAAPISVGATFQLGGVGNGTLTLIAAGTFLTSVAQTHNNSGSDVLDGGVFLVRGDNLAGTIGARSQFRITSQFVANTFARMLVGGAGQTYADAITGNAGTPGVSIVRHMIGDTSSTGNGIGFVTYDRGPDGTQDADDPGIRLLTANEYSNTITSGEGALDANLQNKRLTSAVAGINATTRITSLFLEQGGSVSGSGTLEVVSGDILATGNNTAINVAALQSGVTTFKPSGEQMTLITPNSDDHLTIGSQIVGTTGLGLVKAGFGTAVLNGANNYTGITTINRGALRAIDGIGLPTNSNLRFGGEGVFESSGTFSRSLGTGITNVRWDDFASGGFAAFGGSLNVQLNGGASLITWDNTANFVQGHRNLMLNSVSADNVVTFQNALSLGTFDAAANDRTDSIYRTIEVLDNPNLIADFARISGNISGIDARLQLRKIGAGTLELSGTNSYVGRTLVEEGTLLITGSTSGQGSYVVGNDATLGGTGIIGLAPTTAIELEDGGILSPGINGAGTLTINGNLLLSNASELAYDLTTPFVVGGPNDLVIVNGDLVLDGILDLSDVNLTAGTYRLFDYTGSLTNNGLSLFGPEQMGLTLDLSIIGQVNLVATTPIPEPSTLVLLAMGVLAVRRRRVKAVRTI